MSSNDSSTSTATTASANSATTTAGATTERGVWSSLEHDKFLAALKLYPEGPWRAIADFVGTRSARQVQTHAQKYYEKVSRRVRGLRKDRRRVARAEHRLDDDMAQLCQDTAVVQQQLQQQHGQVGANTSDSTNYLNRVDHSDADDSNTSAALARHTRRELQVLAMHRRRRESSVDVKMDDMHLSDAAAITSDGDASSGVARLHAKRQSESDLHHPHNGEQDSDDSDSSLSALDDDDLDYLLHILESSDQDEHEHEHEQGWCW